MARKTLTTGMKEIDKLIGGVLAGDNLVWEVDSGAPIDKFISSYVAACQAEKTQTIYVSFNRSPQTIINTYGKLMSPGNFRIIDCTVNNSGRCNFSKASINNQINHIFISFMNQFRICSVFN